MVLVASGSNIILLILVLNFLGTFESFGETIHVTNRQTELLGSLEENQSGDENENLRRVNLSIHKDLTEVNRRVQKLEKETASCCNDDANPSSGEGSAKGIGSSYIRWGRKTCGNTSELLYEGFAAGQHYTHTGGASNYLCLPLQPEWSKASQHRQGHMWWFFVTQHETSAPFSRCWYSQGVGIPKVLVCKFVDTSGPFLNCKVQVSRFRPYTEYEGYLMSGHHTHKRAYDYVCVDNNPEAVAGRDGNEDGALFYFVQTSCPSTGHCPPYIESAELTCVVCSK